MKIINLTFNRAILTILVLLSMACRNVYASLDTPLESIDDNEHRLSDYIGQGKWVVLNIWGTRCPPCREEMPELVSFHDEHKDNDAIVVGIAIDFPSFTYANKDEVLAFADDYLIDFPVLLSDSSITEKIGLGRLEALPTTYLFNPAGDVVGVQVGAVSKKILEDFIHQKMLQPRGSSNK